MKLKFKQIKIENFMSLGEITLDLDNLGYTLISGINNNPDDLAKSNGSGKSSIFDAIMWCLTGTTIRGNKDVVNIYANDGTVVVLKFNADGKEYMLVRAKNHSVWKTNLKIYIDEEDVSGKGIRDSEKLLSDYLPELTTELLNSVVLLGQGLPRRFTNNTPSGRKDMLEKLCKSDFMILDLKEKISARKSFLDNELRDAENVALVQETKITLAKENIEKTRAKVEETIKETDLDEQIKARQESIVYHESLIQQYTQQRDAARTVENTLSNRLAGLSKERYEMISSIHDKYDTPITDARLAKEKRQAELTFAMKTLEQQKNIKDVCPTCGQKLLNVVKPDLTPAQQAVDQAKLLLDAANLALDELQRKLHEEDTAARLEYADKEKDLELQLTTVRQEVTANQENIDDISNTVVGLKLNIQELEGRKLAREQILATAEATIKENEALIAEAQEVQLYEYKRKDDVASRLGIVNKFNTLIARDFRGYLLQSIIQYVDKRAKVYSKSIFDTELIEFVLDGNNISISYNKKEYESLSGGEKQKVDLIIQFAIRDMMCNYTGFSANILVLDEIFDNLDSVGSAKVIDLISTELNDISSVFLITHHGSELNIPSDNEIVVVKGPDGISKLQ